VARELQARSAPVSVAETYWVQIRSVARASQNRASRAQDSRDRDLQVQDLQVPDSLVLVHLKIRKIPLVRLRCQPSN
jgi:hypothetical protein